MKLKQQDLLALVVIVSVTIVIFRKFFFQDLVPIPYNILVGWYFPFNLGGWVDYLPGIPFKGGLFAADVFRQMIPWKMLSLDLIKSGQLPLWNPYNFSGEPLLANIQATIFYPLSAIFLFLEFNTAWSIYIVLSPFLGLIFAYFFLRSLKLGSWASILGAFSFALSGHMLSWLEWGVVTHSGIWLPLILFSINKWVRDKKSWALPILVFAVVSTILGGYPQESVYALTLSTIYFFWIKRKFSGPKTAHTLAVALIIFALTAFQLVSTARLFTQSALRTQTSQALYLRTRLSLQHALTLVTPNYFGNRITDNYWADRFTKVDYTDANMFIGTVALIFAVYSLTIVKKKPSHNFFLLTALISFLFALKSPLTSLLSVLRIPIVSTGVATGILYLTVTGLSFSAAFGFDFWLKSMQSKTLSKTLIIFLLAVIYWALIPQEVKHITTKALIVPFLIALATYSAAAISDLSTKYLKTLKPYLKPVFGVVMPLAIVSISLSEYLFYAEKTLSFSSRKHSYPEHFMLTNLRDIAGLNRVMGFWDSEISNNLHTQYQLYSSEGYNPLHSKTYQELTSSGETGTLPQILHRSDADSAVKNEKNRNRFIDLASVKFIAAKVTDPEKEWEQEPLKYDPLRFKLVWQSSRFKIYENLHALPRVSLYSDYDVIPDRHQRIEKLYSLSWNPQQSIILNSSPNLEIDQNSTGSAKISSYTPNQVDVTTNTQNGNALLLLTDSFYPSWRAFIDGKETDILPANHTFRSVIVPPGEHKITFKVYWP